MSYTDRSASWRTSTLHCRSCAPRSTGGGGCTQCPPGPTGATGPRGFDGATGPTGPTASAATWSQYAATRDVSFGCFLLNDVSGINFCDGSYIGHGASLDIIGSANINMRTNNQDIKLQRYDVTGAVSETLLRLDASGQTSITSGADTAKLQLTAVGGAVGTISVDDNEPGLLISSPAPNNVIIQSGMSSYVKTTNAGGNVLLQVEGNSEAVLGFGSFTVAAQAADQGVVRVQAQGGKGGDITADEAQGSFIVEGKNGLGTIIQNDTRVEIAAYGLLSDVSMTTGAGESQISMNSDGAGSGTISLVTNNPGGVINDVKLNPAGIVIQSPSINTSLVNPNDVNQTIYTLFDPANYIQLSINDGIAAQGADISMFNNGGLSINATDSLYVGANSAQLQFFNDVTLTAAQTTIEGGGIRFAKSATNVNPITSDNYAITYTQVGPFTRILPAVTSSNVGQMFLITYTGIGVLTLSASGAQLIYSNGTGTNTKAITTNNTYLLTAIQTTISSVAYGWSMVGYGTTPLVWGSFSSTVSTPIPDASGTIPDVSANTTVFASYNTSDITPLNCSYVGSEINVTQICSKLRIQVSLIASTSTPATTFRFWLVKNGGNVPNTTSVINIKEVNDKILTVCEWFVTSVVNDKFKVAFQSNKDGARIVADISGGSAPNNYPASPSIITTVQGFP